MKYGLVIYKDTDNIGDDIQSFAAMRFLPQIDYLIDRERLDLFVPDDNEQIATIMNGWYMHNKYNWPPSPYIYPIYISIHFTMRDYMQIGQKFLEGLGKEHLKKYEPIGCRDESTLRTLQDIGIESYLSGCMTLTLSKQYDIDKFHDDYICLVDVDEAIIERVKNQAGEMKIKLISHNVDYFNSNLTWDERVQRVKELLGIYQQAKCVITSRLHCALPCLAIETPVLLIQNSENDDRFSNFFDFLNHCTKDEFLEGTYSYDIHNPLQNNNKYLEIRKSIENKCREFVDSVKDINIIDNSIPSIYDYKNMWVDKALWQKQLIMNKSNEYLYQIADYISYIKKLENGKKWLEEQCNNEVKLRDELKKWIYELEEGKEWLENQYNNEKKSNNVLTKWVSELECGKKWIEEQYDKEVRKNKELSNQNEELEKTIYELKNENSKLSYKFNVIKGNKIIKTIIKWKRYDI